MFDLITGIEYNFYNYILTIMFWRKLQKSRLKYEFLFLTLPLVIQPS